MAIERAAFFNNAHLWTAEKEQRKKVRIRNTKILIKALYWNNRAINRFVSHMRRSRPFSNPRSEKLIQDVT
jgi:hypothetical protein